MSSFLKAQKYIMFLNPIYFKKTFFKSVYNKIKRKLENKGITLFNIDEANYEIQNKIKNITPKITFDDLLFPNTNTLYIHLFGNKYYSDKMYNKKKIEIEREMLILLAGKLGVKKINFDTEIIETTITKLSANIKIKGKGPSASFTKSINKSTGSSGEEEYLNRGAPVYLKFTNLQEVEKNIEDKMDSTIFNYNFYKNTPKLESFVYKRFEFKMQKLEYTIETEDVSDLSFAVKAYFMDYGIDISFDKNISYYENIHYKLEFFTDDELKREFGKKIRNYKDKFYTIREYYDLLENKDKAVHFITEYVMEYADKYNYKLIDNLDNNSHNFSKHIQNFIKENESGKFETVCHDFQSTSQIRNWINKEFFNDNMEIINEMDITDNNNNDVIKEDKIENKFNKYDKMSIILPFEKKENNIIDLQHQLEYLVINNNSSDLSNEPSITYNNENDTTENDELVRINSLKLKSFESIMHIEEERRIIEEERMEQYKKMKAKMVEDSFAAAMRMEKQRMDELKKITIESYESAKITEESFAAAMHKNIMDEHKTVAQDSYEAIKITETYINGENEEHTENEENTENNNINYRTPVFPASSTTSINSIFEIERLVVFPNFPPPPPPPSLSSQ
jgi:hypothetical protein